MQKRKKNSKNKKTREEAKSAHTFKMKAKSAKLTV